MTGTESVRTEHRRTLHLTFEEPEQQQRRVPADPPVATDRPAPRLTARERTLVIAERWLGSWAPTLRLALLLVASVVVGLALIAWLAGPYPAAVTALLLVGIAGARRT
ncbi:hypothetical protein V5P93_007342 [Actinokineospora auranticolor]|uniref:hypothetical protein n=1 Tax=Actinokineospora auranticolor TaxID=155976 RepID=UPI0011B0A6DA|nr:hypothetical protein [Actinokineospora auranticolor]